MNINRIKKNIKKVEEIVENIDAQDIINRMEIDKENSIEELEQRLEELYRTQQARLDAGADDLDIREEIAEVEEEIKELQDETMEENSIKNERRSIKEDIERLKLCSTNQCNICGRYEKEECMLERNRCEQHILSEYKRVLKENEELKIIKSAIQTLQINSLEEEKYIVISKDSFLDGSYKHLLDDYIPKQRVKDIIDRIDYDIKKTKEIISKNTNIYASYRKNDYQIVRLKAMNTKSLDIKKRLQELLESEE